MGGGGGGCVRGGERGQTVLVHFVVNTVSSLNKTKKWLNNLLLVCAVGTYWHSPAQDYFFGAQTKRPKTKRPQT